MATVPSRARAAALPGFCKRLFADSDEWSWENWRLHKRAFLSFHTPSLHTKLAANVANCWNHGQSDFSASHAYDKKARKKQLWQEFFSDPSQWVDNRLMKKSSRDPDFTHKVTLEALWIDGWFNPVWVKEKIATMGYDQTQPIGISASRMTTIGNYDMIQKLSEEGRLKEALHLLEPMAYQSSEAPKGAFVCLLRQCTRRKALAEGKQVHALIVQTRCDTHIFLSNLLIQMYSNCGSVVEALKVFTAMPQRNVFSWTAMISAYANNGQFEDALTLFQLMQQTGIEPNKVALLVALNACTSIAALKQGQQLHALIVKRGYDSDLMVQTSLIDMYVKCGCLKDAHELFKDMSQRNVVSWNVMIAGYAHKGHGKEALDLYEQMKLQGMEPDKVTLVLLLKACTSISALDKGKQLQSFILEKGFESERIIQTALVDMHAKCGCLKDARELFNSIPQRNVVTWNVMIAGYAQKGLGKEALDLYEEMNRIGLEPDKVTFIFLLKACTSISALERGKQLHSLILEKGLESELNIQNTLLDMYAKCGCLKDARELFNNMHKRDVVSWSLMIASYAKKGLGHEALDLYEQMKHEGMEPNKVTLVLLLKACASISALDQGRQLHDFILQKGFESEVTIQTTLLDMYAKCGCLKEACELFNNMRTRDVVSWSAMIAAYAQEGLGHKALDLYEQMQHEGMEPNKVTLVLLLKACASISALEQGRQLHSLIQEKGLESEMNIQNTLIDMYAKCGCLRDARELFNNMHNRDAVSWSAMIAGYAQKGLGKEALDLYEQMKHEGLQASEVTYTCVLSACSHSGLLAEGCHIFESMFKDHGVTPTLEHCGCMVDLLGRAGLLADAEDFILKMPVQPDEVVWMSLLWAARKYVNVEVGRRAFDHIVELKPAEAAASYLLLIDIYSAAGRMDEVAQLGKEMKHKGLGNLLVAVEGIL